LSGDALGFGIVGYGAFGRLHAQCLERVPEARLVAICAKGEESAADARRDWPDAAVCRDYRELVRAPGVDVVDVVVPNHLHAEVAIAALEAGRDVLLEKPMATTVPDCDRIVEAAGRTGRLVSVGFELRLSTQWGAIRRLIDEGAIGWPCYANLSLFRHPYRQGAAGWRYDPARVGSWILEEPVHFFDLLLWYFADVGDPVAVRANGGTSGRSPESGRPGMYDNFTTWLGFPGGRFAVVNQTLAGFEHHMVLDLTGDAGSLRAWWSGAGARDRGPAFELKVMRHGRAEAATLPLDKSGEVFELETEIRETARAFRARRTLVGAEEARKRVVVCLEAERSAREGKELALGF